MHNIPPGLAVTIWDSNGIKVAIDKSQDALARIRPDVVQMHTTPGKDFAAHVARVRSILPKARIWVGLPADHLVKLGVTEAAKRVRKYVRLCRDVGVEMFVFNGEAAWKKGARAFLAELAKACIAAARAEAPDLPLGWTSFDHLGSHGLPWAPILGPDGVDYHLPQHYTAIEGRVSSWRSVAARITKAAAKSRVAGVLPCFLPGGDRWIPYGQCHHHDAAAICYLSNQSPWVAYWALSSRSDANGVTGMWAAQALRKLAGHSKGHVQLAQGRLGLVVDGIVGKATLGAL